MIIEDKDVYKNKWAKNKKYHHKITQERDKQDDVTRIYLII